MLRARSHGVVYFYLVLLIIRCVTPETDDKRCVKEGKTREEKNNCSDSASLRRARKILARTVDSIRILDLSEAQERHESKRQTMFMSIVMEA